MCISVHHNLFCSLVEFTSLTEKATRLWHCQRINWPAIDPGAQAHTCWQEAVYSYSAANLRPHSAFSIRDTISTPSICWCRRENGGMEDNHDSSLPHLWLCDNWWWHTCRYVLSPLPPTAYLSTYIHKSLTNYVHTCCYVFMTLSVHTSVHVSVCFLVTLAVDTSNTNILNVKPGSKRCSQPLSGMDGITF